MNSTTHQNESPEGEAGTSEIHGIHYGSLYGRIEEFLDEMDLHVEYPEFFEKPSLQLKKHSSFFSLGSVSTTTSESSKTLLFTTTTKSSLLIRRRRSNDT